MSFRKILAFAVSFGVAAANGPAHAENQVYVFILGARDNPYWNVVADGVRDEGKAKGIAPIIYTAESGSDTEGELNVCLTALQLKPAIIVMGSLNTSVGIQCFKKAAEKRIIAADVDTTVTVDEARQAGIKLAFSVGSDNNALGGEAAEYVHNIAAKSDPKIFILEGLPGSVPGQKRVAGFREKLREVMPKAEIAASISADWDRLKAMNITLDLLQRQPDLDIIYAANDVMALGAAEAVRNLGLEKQIRVIGVDGTADARKAVMDGRMAASVAQLPYLMGMRAVDLAIAAVKDGKTGVSETTATLILTRQLIEDGKDPVLQYIR